MRRVGPAVRARAEGIKEGVRSLVGDIENRAPTDRSTSGSDAVEGAVKTLKKDARQLGVAGHRPVVELIQDVVFISGRRHLGRDMNHQN